MSTIMQVLPANILGGMEKETLETAKAIVQSGNNSLVVSRSGPIVAKLAEVNSLHYALNTKTTNPFNILRNRNQLVQIIKEHNVELMHARSRDAAWTCHLASKKIDIALITSVYGAYNNTNIFKRAYNKVIMKGDIIVAVSNFIKQYILANYLITDESKVRVVPMGIDHRYYDLSNIKQNKVDEFKQKYAVPKDCIVLLLPSRFIASQGHQLLIKALAKLRHLNFYCIMAGDLSKNPDYTVCIQNMINQLKLQSKIQIFGPEKDILHLYALSDIVLSVAQEPEAFVRTLIEAQMMQKFVITTNIGAAGQVVKDQDSGLHFQSGNIQDLADKISYALQEFNSEKYIQITKAGQLSALKSYPIEVVQKQLLDIYAELL